MESVVGRETVARWRGSLAIVAGILAAGLLLLPEPAASIDERSLSFYHTHTGKRLDVVYARGGEYLEPALEEVERFLSDFRTGDRKTIDPELLDLLYELRETVGSDGTFEVISAYRSPKTNEMLRTRGSGVAKASQHLVGKAIDVRLRDVSLVRLRNAAISMERGGVGYYEASDFVHLDTGRVRRW